MIFFSYGLLQKLTFISRLKSVPSINISISRAKETFFTYINNSKHSFQMFTSSWMIIASRYVYTVQCDVKKMPKLHISSSSVKYLRHNTALVWLFNFQLNLRYCTNLKIQRWTVTWTVREVHFSIGQEKKHHEWCFQRSHGIHKAAFKRATIGRCQPNCQQETPITMKLSFEEFYSVLHNDQYIVWKGLHCIWFPTLLENGCVVRQ